MRKKGFTLIELMIVVAIIAVIAAIAIPNLLQSRIASNESAAIAGMRAYLGAQNTFHRTDFYRKGGLVYANPDATQGVSNGFPDLYQVGYQEGGGGTLIGEQIKLLDVTFANAHSDRGNKAKAGYHFDDLVAGIANYDFQIDCGLCAAPFSYNRSGRNLFIVDVTGTVYQKDAAVEISGTTTGTKVTPITTYPNATGIATWIPVGSE